MEPRGIYNLSIENQTSGRHTSRIGLLRHRTGVPVVPLFLQGISHPFSQELHSMEDIETQILASTCLFDKEAWALLFPFFEMGASHAYVIALPFDPNHRLSSLLGSDRGLHSRTGIHAIKNFSEVADLVVVPQASQILGFEEHKAFHVSLFDIISPLNHFFMLTDFPKQADETLVESWLKGIYCPNAAAYFPWLRGASRLTPPAIVAAAAFQVSDAAYGINEIPANRPLNEGYQPVRRFRPATLHPLLEMRVNLFHQFGTGDCRVWGGRTLAESVDLDNRFVSTRRTVLALREAIHQICEPFVLEPMQDGLADLVDVALQSAFQPLVKIFDPNAKQPFQTQIAIVPKGTEDILQVDVTFCIPYAVDQMSVSLGLTG